MDDVLSIPARTAAVTRAALRLCLARAWAPVLEVPLPNGRRADILALRPDGGFAIIEVKSCARDFLSDGKWPEYREFCDEMHFAVDLDFPQELLPEDCGLWVSDGYEATSIRDSFQHKMAPARRKALTHRFACVAATRLAAEVDPVGAMERRAALLSD
ncbi:MmcB family DNA repair protein [Sabulicella glaciei]|uniref:MmcB family DNA repair protein n=1 Tax=Sabulicella glaciei TaxID=2984948 RepID=A0ABT3NTZ8_9PROT|nr:MmcB family DNA repair protein [Roseococcus sp. MDT2-1-1]MCW8085358.1 MmcB family DNA repair protein [Roseococcus sp. MDT2-1-1]